MNTESTLQIGQVQATLQKKDIKHMYIGVYPPNGDVRIDVPHTTNEDVIRVFTASKLPWIKKQQKKFRQQERETPRQYISGESYYYLGQQFRLNVITHDAKKIVKKAKSIELHIPKDSSLNQKQKLLETWYREELSQLIEKSIKKWSTKTKIKVNEFRIKKMKTKWGTSNQQAKRIWLNLELIKRPTKCIDYIVLHEIIHLKEREHNKQFYDLLEKYMPTWKEQKQELTDYLIGYSKWKNK